MSQAQVWHCKVVSLTGLPLYSCVSVRIGTLQLCQSQVWHFTVVSVIGVALYSGVSVSFGTLQLCLSPRFGT